MICCDRPELRHLSYWWAIHAAANTSRFMPRTYARDVAGLVLVDPSFAGQDRSLDAVLTPEQRTLRAKDDNDRITRLQNCLNLARDRTLLWLLSSSCLDNPPNTDPVLHSALNREYALPEYWAATLSERQSAHTAKAGLSTDDAEMPPTGPHFGDMPVEVLTSEALVNGPWLAGHVTLSRSLYARIPRHH